MKPPVTMANIHGNSRLWLVADSQRKIQCVPLRLLIGMAALLLAPGSAEAQARAIGRGTSAPLIGTEPTPPATSAKPSSMTPQSLPLAARPPILTGSLSLDEAVKIALRYSPLILQTRQQTAADVARIASAEAAGKPSVSASLIVARSSWNNIVTSPDVAPPVYFAGVPRGNLVDQNITVMIPIYTGGRVQAAVRAARREEEASLGDANAQQQDTVLQVRAAYRRALYLRELMGAQQQNRGALQEALRIDTERFQVGKIAQVVVYRDQASLAGAQQEVTNAGRDWRQSLYSLSVLMGVSLKSQYLMTGSLETPRKTTENTIQPAASLTATSVLLAAENRAELSPGDEAEVNRIVDAAFVHRPEVLAAERRVQAAEAQLAKTRAAFRPQINLIAMGDLVRGGGIDRAPNYTLAVAAGLPLFEGGALAANQREMESFLAKARAMDTGVRLQVENDVRASWLSQEAAAQNLATSHDALRSAQESFDIQVFRFASGKGIQLEVLDALAARTMAQVQVSRARYEYALAQDQLYRAAGTIPTIAVGHSGLP